MDHKPILTARELADYMRINEKHLRLQDHQKGDLEFMETGQWKPELVPVDHHLQRKLLESRDEDLDLVIRSDDHPLPLSRMVDETLIELELRAETKNKALSNLARMASMGRIVSSYEEFYLELKEREGVFSTAVGNGVAIPHSRFPYRMVHKQPRLIIARSRMGVDFGVPDHRKVHLFFLPCAPTQFIHLRMIAQIAKLIHAPEMVGGLKNAAGKKEVLAMIRAFEQR